MSLVEVSKIGELEDETMKKLSIGGHDILLARVGDRYYATANSCPHMGGNLSQGKLEGTIVTCPVHGSQFDLTNGQVIRWTDWTGLLAAVSKIVRSPRPLRTYKVQVEGDKIMVEV
ncbi:MAG: (2Fe-2S)-binding protein [Chloroflexi bacterium RBG_13_54_9]|nr:MAG: (2Fe-2S)-binding protein [Chloroflexi bacterium RBG_13_54_9]